MTKKLTALVATTIVVVAHLTGCTCTTTETQAQSSMQAVKAEVAPR